MHKKRQPNVSEPRINPKLSLYESDVESFAYTLTATIAAVALAATEATLAMIA